MQSYEATKKGQNHQKEKRRPTENGQNKDTLQKAHLRSFFVNPLLCLTRPRPWRHFFNDSVRKPGWCEIEWGKTKDELEFEEETGRGKCCVVVVDVVVILSAVGHSPCQKFNWEARQRQCQRPDMSRYRILKSPLFGRYFLTHPSRYRFFKTSPLFITAKVLYFDKSLLHHCQVASAFVTPCQIHRS